MQRSDGTFQKRLHRWESGPITRYLTFSCFGRQQLLTPEFTALFAALLARCISKYGFGLIAWVIMPEHVHFIVEPPPSEQPLMPKFLRSLKQPLGQRLVATYRRRGISLASITNSRGDRQVWQDGGGFDRNVRTLDELKREVAYIHRNPVERGLVATPTDWEWSSARWYAGIRGEDAGWGGRIPIVKSRADWGLQNP
jgi:putative transposase